MITMTNICKTLEKEMKKKGTLGYWTINYSKYSRIIRFFGDGLLLLKAVYRTDKKIEMVWISRNYEHECSPCCVKEIDQFKTICLNISKGTV
jgi:hypothetical protein